MLPEPTLILTLPSIHDGTTLDCRIYHPASLTANPSSPQWRRYGVILAHPYAPLGGSFDDPILEVVATALLRSGFLVAMFNFRGAGNSAGRTSWTAKAERDDYATVTGFVVYYMHWLDPFKASKPYIIEEAIGNNTATDGAAAAAAGPTLLLAGYSYGAMITATLPPLNEILGQFETPSSHSNAAQIRLRAESLAEQQNLVLADARSALLQHRSPSSPTKRRIRIGGEEGGGGGMSPRRSTESFGRRSFSFDAEEKFRKGVQELLNKRKTARHGTTRTGALHSSQDDELKKDETADPAGGHLHAVTGLTIPQPAYLLISPLQGIVTHLITMSVVPSALTRSKYPDAQAAEDKLVHNPTLAVFGDNDMFVGISKLRSWAERLGAEPTSRFTGAEVATAGHFWAEKGVMQQLIDLIADFTGTLLTVDQEI